MKKWIPFFLTIVMILAFFSGKRLTHEIVGITAGILLILHLVSYWKWWGTINKGKYTAKRAFMVVTNILFFIAMIIVLGTGILGARFLFNFTPYWGQYYKLLHITHITAAYAMILMLVIHIGMRLHYFKDLYFRLINKK